MTKPVDEWTGRVRTTHKTGSLLLANVQGDAYAVPAELTWHLEGDQSLPPGQRWPDITARIEIRDGAAICSELRIVSKPDDRPIRTTDLQDLDINGILEQALLTVASQKVSRTQTGWVTGYNGEAASDPGARAAVHRAVEAGYGDPLSELREVARIYLSAMRGTSRRKPTESVLDVLGYGSRATASRKVKAARQAGLIPQVGASDVEHYAAWLKLYAPPRPVETPEQVERIGRAMLDRSLPEVMAEVRAEQDAAYAVVIEEFVRDNPPPARSGGEA